MMKGSQMSLDGRTTVDGHEECRSEIDGIRRILKETREVLKSVGQLAYAASLSGAQAAWVTEQCKRVDVDLEGEE
jgi:hypothetical protein